MDTPQNLFNDYTDYVRGVDQKLYRAMYGPNLLWRSDDKKSEPSYL